jgi:hypothetical protein
MGWLDAAIDVGTDALKSNAGKIASGVAGAVLGSGNKKTGGISTDASKSGTSITQMPAWMNEYAQQLLTQQNNLSNQGYQQYTGEQVAGLTPDQQAAANLTRGNTGQTGALIANAMGGYDPNAGKGMLAKAGDYLSNAGGSWLDPGVSGRYMADYQANVTNPAVAQAQRQWNESINPSIQSTFSGAKGVGSYGSTGMLRSLQSAGVDLNTKLGEQMAQYLDRGYSGGMGQFNTENTQKGQLAQLAGNLGGQEQALAGTALGNQIKGAEAWSGAQNNDISALQKIGAQEQGVTQAQLDAAKANWDAAQAYSQNQINQGAGLLGKLAGNVDKSVSTSDKSSSDQSSSKYIDPVTGAIQGMETGSQLAEILAGLKKPPVTTTTPAGGYNDQGDVVMARGGMLRRLAESDRRARSRGAR